MNWYEDEIKKHKRYQFTDLASDIDILHPQFAFQILQLFINAHKKGHKICVFETYRSQERQLDLFNKGRTKLRNNGMHHFGIAADVVFRNEKNYPIWQGNWEEIGTIGKELGLFWGGDWESFRDYPHYQLVEATVSHQAEIIKGNYPSHDEGVDEHVRRLIPLYNAVVENNYSEESLSALIGCYDNLMAPPKIDAMEEPELKKIEIAEEKPKTEAAIKLPRTDTGGLFYLIIKFLNKWLKGE